MTTTAAETVINLAELDTETADSIVALTIGIREVRREKDGCDSRERELRGQLGQIVSSYGAAIQIENMALVRYNDATTVTRWDTRALERLLVRLVQEQNPLAKEIADCKRLDIREAHTQITFAKAQA